MTGTIEKEKPVVDRLATSYHLRPWSPARILESGLSSLDAEAVFVLLIGMPIAWLVTAYLVGLGMVGLEVSSETFRFVQKTIGCLFATILASMMLTHSLSSDDEQRSTVADMCAELLLRYASDAERSVSLDEIRDAIGDEDPKWRKRIRRLLIEFGALHERFRGSLDGLEEHDAERLSGVYRNRVDDLVVRVVDEHRSWQTRRAAMRRTSAQRVEDTGRDLMRLSPGRDRKRLMGHRPRTPDASRDPAFRMLMEDAEGIVAEDPDAIDDAGARIDALVSEHLPRLRDRHAAALAATRDAGRRKEADAVFQEGIALARRSVDEAWTRRSETLSRDLDVEIAFLRSRREAADANTVGRSS